MGLIPDPGSFTCFGCQKGGKGRKEGKGEGGKEGGRKEGREEGERMSGASVEY